MKKGSGKGGQATSGEKSAILKPPGGGTICIDYRLPTTDYRQLFFFYEFPVSFHFRRGAAPS